MTNPIYSLYVKKLRKEWAANDIKRDSNISMPENVVLCDNISYGPHGKDNLLCVFMPKVSETEQKQNSRKLPCIINIHGGGFFYGSKDLYKYYCAYLASKGFVVIGFDYRLSPENKFPSPLEDTNEAVKWTLSNADEFKIDTSKIFFSGDSAGGQLVLHYTTILTNPAFAKLYELQLPDFTPKACLLNCALCDITKSQKSEDKFIQGIYIPHLKKNRERIDVQKYLTSNFPPTFIMTGTKDFLQTENQKLYELFNSLKIPVTFKLYGKNTTEKAYHVFHLNIISPLAIQCNQDEINFLSQF